MGAVTFRAKTELRHRLRSALLLVARDRHRRRRDAHRARGCAAHAAARSTGSSRTRTRRRAGSSADPALYDRIARLPARRGHGPDGALRHGAARRRAAGRSRTTRFGAVAISNLGITRPILLAGRLPARRPARRGRDQRDGRAEPALARRRHAAVRRLRTGSGGGAPRGNRCRTPRGPTVAVRIVGIVRLLTDLSTAQSTPDVSYTGQRRRLLHARVPRRLRGPDRRSRAASSSSCGSTTRRRSRQFAAGVDRLSGGQGLRLQPTPTT